MRLGTGVLSGAHAAMLCRCALALAPTGTPPVCRRLEPSPTITHAAGKGAIVAKELSREIRSHKDLEKDTCEFWRPALSFYENIATTLIAHAHTLDVFACALEQSGLAEMKPAIQGTGGLVVQTDTFRNPMFQDSLTRVFANQGDEGFSGRCSCATLDVYTSRDIKLQVRAPLCAVRSLARCNPPAHPLKLRRSDIGTCGQQRPRLHVPSTCVCRAC